MRIFGISSVHCLAVVSQSLLGEAFRIARNLRPFSPGVAIAVQRNTFDAQTPTALLELGRSVTGTHSG